MKFCKWCNETKPLEEFHKHKGMKDGRLNKCRTCVQEAVAQWRVQEQKFDCDFTAFVMEEMADLRDKRKEATGFDWHIDHVVPLNSPKASGLHLWINLQLVPASWNVRKGNSNFDEWAPL